MILFITLGLVAGCDGSGTDTATPAGEGAVCATIDGSPNPGGFLGCLPVSWDDEVAWSFIAMSECSGCGASLYSQMGPGPSTLDCSDGITSVKVEDPDFGEENFAFAGVAGYGDNEVSDGACTFTTNAWEVDEVSGVVHLEATIEATVVLANRDTLAVTGEELDVVIEVDATEDVTPLR